MSAGVYCLLIGLKKKSGIRIGKLGTFDFRPGYYVYTGSARNGLESRIARHLSKDKKHHWHVDYLLGQARIAEYKTFRNLGECELNGRIQSLPGSNVPVPGFGSSDCRCLSHLTYFRDRPSTSSIYIP